MTAHGLRIELLSQSHGRAGFSSGNDDLDRYFRERAGQDQRRRRSAVFVLYDIANHAVAGYYTLSACQIESGALPNELAKRLPRRPLPATLIGRLATDLRYRGRELGGLLLVNALSQAAKASRGIGSMAVIVDAKDDQVRGFYEHYGFQRFADDPYRLFLPMGDVVRVVDAVGLT